MALPSLENLAYPRDDADHPGGGHCAGLGGESPAEDRITMVEQYITALDVLVASALESGNGWGLTRPILFSVHQLCEVALDHAVHRTGRKAKKAERHALAERWVAGGSNGGFDHLTSEERAWCGRFIDTISPITRDGYPGRYANSRRDGVQLDDVWCCINVEAIRDATVTFVRLIVPEVTGDQVS